MGLLYSSRRALLDRAVAAVPWWDPNNEGLCAWSAYQPVGAASFAASILDLSGNGNDAGDPGGAATPGWDAINGWVFDGVGDYLTTTFVPANDQSQSILVQYTGAAANNAATLGTDNAANRMFQIFPNTVAANVVYRNGNQVAVAPGLIAGNLGIAGNQGYRNGAADGGAIGAWAGVSALAVYIGCTNNGAPIFFRACNIQAVAIYDCILTAPQMLAIATAMAAL